MRPLGAILGYAGIAMIIVGLWWVSPAVSIIACGVTLLSFAWAAFELATQDSSRKESKE